MCRWRGDASGLMVMYQMVLIIVFVVWRTETLQTLTTQGEIVEEEEEDSNSNSNI